MLHVTQIHKIVVAVEWWLYCLFHTAGEHSEHQQSMTWPNTLKGAPAVNFGSDPHGPIQQAPPPNVSNNHLDMTSAKRRKQTLHVTLICDNETSAAHQIANSKSSCYSNVPLCTDVVLTCSQDITLFYRTWSVTVLQNMKCNCFTEHEVSL
jgi:hypothetical protein